MRANWIHHPARGGAERGVFGFSASRRFRLMYSIVLAMALAPGNALPAADFETDIRDLKRSIAQPRAEQNEARIDELKLVIVGLRQQLTDEKLDELRRDIRALRIEEELVPARAVVFPMPNTVTPANRATVAVEI